MADAVLQIEGLTKNFGGLRITDKVTLDVRPGELHAIIGPNGAGKTTLINQVCGTLRPDAGRIVFCDEDITRLPVERRAQRGLARSFQITSILPGFSVMENVALAVQARSGSSFRFFGSAAGEKRLNVQALAALPWSYGGAVREHAPELLHQLAIDAREVWLTWLADPAREGDLEDGGPRLGGQAGGRLGDTAVA